MKVIVYIIAALCLSGQVQIAGAQSPSPEGKAEREYCIKTLTRIADPLLVALSRNELKKTMPVEARDPKDRATVTHLEGFGRLLAGMAPWLELGPDDTAEGKLRKKYIDLAVVGIKNATDPASPDFMNFNRGGQPLVDAAFLCQALLRAPKQLWGNLDDVSRKNLVAALKSSRVITPGYNNWLLFAATVEAALEHFDHSGDKMRIDYAIKSHLQWYKGDGVYGDGPNFHWDYYNSFVIQPMLVEVLEETRNTTPDAKRTYDLITERARRYAAIQERLISPEGTYPLIGRSIAYRFGAFQVLSKMALMKALPANITPQQVRFALYTVIKRQIEAPGTFDAAGWLRIGFYGSQPNLGENYISTGSLYLCSQAFLVLGLPATDAFWIAPDADWTARRAWKGEEVDIDHAMTETR
ncbi:DUF2264 domain-containing protein [Hufsiella ginkgonis]|uniref:DUF2264 domain-containing protein n=1 Tax=Hufsiella ginkgonis TaxID=2695274 RepID=A0A7K1Y3Q5_9SPHI|nr:DUF2264 domain-containing protein [Hufsiella ginkgonis]MXV17679.1 DUF2264 domain-containing protein [Hufsiella ginkgonis]